jgi:AcrR family transcriptional regulator
MYEKFLAAEAEKQSRIMNAAMKEFLNGFKNASTDKIVREAGISKGLLFHYFGTKENLYDYLIDYAIDTIQSEYLDMINVLQSDIFECIWQMSLLKRDVSLRFPVIFKFLASVYVDSKDCPAKIHLSRFKEMQQKMFAEIFERCDKSLFKNDIDPQKAISIIFWTLEGWADSTAANMSPEKVGQIMSEHYDSYLEEMNEYLNIFRKSFYREG